MTNARLTPLFGALLMTVPGQALAFGFHAMPEIAFDEADVTGHYLSVCTPAADEVDIVHEIVLDDSMINGVGGMKDAVAAGDQVTIQFTWSITLIDAGPLGGLAQVAPGETVRTRVGGLRASTGDWTRFGRLSYDDTTTSPQSSSLPSSFSESHAVTVIVPDAWVDDAEPGDVLLVETTGQVTADCVGGFGQATAKVQYSVSPNSRPHLIWP